MRLKKYNDFQLINENFGNSKEYSDFLADKSLDREFFTDNLMSISDIDGINIRLYKSIVDKNGRFVDAYDDREYFIKYMITIEYKIPTYDSKIDEFFEKVEVFNEVKLSIEELKDRVSDKVDFIWEKAFFEPSEVYRVIEIKEFKFKFSLHFMSKDISSELKSYYDRYKSNIGPGYEKMLNKLRSFYKTYDIDFDKFYDTSSVNDTINIGIFPPNDGDLHHVSNYNKKTDKFDIYHDVLLDSLVDFEVTP